MTKDEINSYLFQLNEELAALEAVGEICLYGGAVMCLVFDARPATKDVDAVFRPTREIRLAAKRVAEHNHLPEDWLNDGVKRFLAAKENTKILAEYSNLRVYYADPHYLLAMKVMAARVDLDRKDIEFLIRKLDIQTADEVFRTVEGYYPQRLIKPAAQFAIEELFNL
jgi:hypothetical protein